MTTSTDDPYTHLLFGIKLLDAEEMTVTVRLRGASGERSSTRTVTTKDIERVPDLRELMAAAAQSYYRMQEGRG
jgi:hypothetical protein